MICKSCEKIFGPESKEAKFLHKTELDRKFHAEIHSMFPDTSPDSIIKEQQFCFGIPQFSANSATEIKDATEDDDTEIICLDDEIIDKNCQPTPIDVNQSKISDKNRPSSSVQSGCGDSITTSSGTAPASVDQSEHPTEIHSANKNLPSVTFFSKSTFQYLVNSSVPTTGWEFDEKVRQVLQTSKISGCVKCSSVMKNTTMEGILSHLNVHLSYQGDLYKCRRCKNQFRDAGKFQRHLQMKHRDIKYSDEDFRWCRYGSQFVEDHRTKQVVQELFKHFLECFFCLVKQLN